jgi:MSHA pilin protein MshD
MTLIEVMVAIVVIGVAGAALVGTLSYLAGTGNTSMQQAQAQSIANAYLTEILGKAFVDPNVSGETLRA